MTGRENEIGPLYDKGKLMNGTGMLSDGWYNEETRRRTRLGWTHQRSRSKGLAVGRALGPTGRLDNVKLVAVSLMDPA